MKPITQVTFPLLFSLIVICLSEAAIAQQPVSGTAANQVRSAAVATTGELLFEDHFDRDTLGDWKVVIPGFSVQDGVLTGRQDRADHGAVGRVYRDFRDVVAEFRFRLAGSTVFNVVFDDRNCRKSHAGHICRVAFSPKAIRLGDDREGVMRNDIFEMRRDPARKA
ncbi:MAG: hypothetical protein KDA85_20380, partial [Planctomycetaceae bacterium]|nr:hypothetical protein [Planctomycetaceae bacterium]